MSETQDLPRPFSAILRQLILSVYAPAFLMSMCQGIALLMIPLYALELGANAGIAALIFSMRGLGNIVFDVPAGALASRLGDKPTMMIGIAIMGVTGIVCSLSTTPLTLAVCAFFFGAAMATWLVGRLTYISEDVPDAHRGKAIATMAGLQRFGNFLGPVAGGIVASRYGFDVVFIAIAVLCLGALTFVAVMIRTAKRDSDEIEHEPLLSSIPKIVLRRKHVFLTAGIAMLLLTVVRACRQLLIPLWGTAIGLDTETIGYVVGAGSAIDMCLFPVAGYMMDNLGRKPTAISCLMILSLGIALVPFTETALTLGLAAMLTGCGNGLGSGINMTMGTDFAPGNGRGEFLGVWRLFGDTGSFGGPMLISFVISASSMTAAFAVTGMTGALGLLLLVLFVREPARKH